MLPCQVAIVRVGSRTECEMTRDVLRAINLAADIRSLRSGDALLRQSSAPLDDAWTVLPISAVTELMSVVRLIAVDGGLAQLFCARLSAPLAASDDVSHAGEPTFSVSGVVDIEPLAPTAELERAQFVRLLAKAIEVPEATMQSQCRVSMWRDPLDGQFRARIAGTLASVCFVCLFVCLARPTGGDDQVRRRWRSRSASMRCAQRPTSICTSTSSSRCACQRRWAPRTCRRVCWRCSARTPANRSRFSS